MIPGQSIDHNGAAAEDTGQPIGPALDPKITIETGRDPL
jgi:hypothetical protein